MFADIVVDVINKEVNKMFEYKIPSNLEDVISVGHRVSVPFGSRKVLGFVMDIHENAKSDISKIKDIDDILDMNAILNKEFITLSEYMVKRYYSFYITCLKCMIPKALSVNYLKIIKLIKPDLIDDELKSLFKDGFYKLKNNDPLVSHFKKLQSKGIVDIIDDFVDKNNIKRVAMIRLISVPIKKLSEQSLKLYEYLKSTNEPISKKDIIAMGYSISSISTLQKNKIIEIYFEEVYRKPYVPTIEEKKVILNEAQVNVYKEIKESYNMHNTFLLHGVCGSGKTEVYLKLIEDVVENGREAIILVPEISLTPQMTERFKSRFSDKVAVLHSRLSDGEKYDEWRRILNGHAKIVVGARSAIFAPFKNLGIIIVDEEQELSYIQDTNPKYDAIDIALFRAKYHNIPLVLGSATPKISDYCKALNGTFKLLNIPYRANLKKEPISEIVDMREELLGGNKSVFSRKLNEALKNTLENHEQAILFINRRGYSNFIMCRCCGQTIDCPNCNMPYTYHKFSDTLKCHHCGNEIKKPIVCPTCHKNYLKPMGDGTEKAIEEIITNYPLANVRRVDADSMSEKNSYTQVFDDFRNHKIDVIVGTQIIAKGLDFPAVSLVGVLNADIGLKMSEYNASEISYDLIEQVSGRAGRSEIEGRVIIQTYLPDHYAIKHASNHDYKGFYMEEIKYRELMKNPPFTNLLEIIVSSSYYKVAYVEAKKIKDAILESNNCQVLGPFEDYIFKLNNNYRYKLSIKFTDADLYETLEDINSVYQTKKDVMISIKRK